MLMYRFLILILIFNSFLFGISIPKTSKFDNRITFATYNANDIYQVNCKNGFVTMLEFGNDERIINIATGFGDGWELVDRENFLFIKPKAYIVKQEEQTISDENELETMVIQPNSVDWKTNLIVTTNKRIYVFDLEIIEESNTNYKVEFLYPDEVFQKQKEMLEQQTKIKEIEQNNKNIKNELDKPTVPRNWDFLMHVNKGSQTISPDFAYDDGVFTYLGFNNTKTIPSVFLYENINGKDKESILNTHLKKDGNYDVLVIHKTAKKILLRSGDKLVGIFNNGYAKNPLDKTYSTITKSIEREIVND